jgi:hypothetical protein
MVLWFVGTAVLSIWYVFRDPAFDYRFLIAGVLLPDVVDGLWGGARALHSVTMSVVTLIGVMMLTIGRRVRRKMLLGIPIGMFLHLVYDGAFANTAVFWWPFTGLSFDGSQLPVVERGWNNVFFEIIGLGLCVFIWRHFTLGQPASRRQFITTGRLGS